MSFKANRSLLVLIAFACGSLGAQQSSTHGPTRGHLVLDGGVAQNHAIDSAFVALAGGPASHIVLIPTAGGPDTFPPEMAAYLERRIKERFGVSVVTLLHTRVRAEADADSFVEPLRKARPASGSSVAFRPTSSRHTSVRRPSARSGSCSTEAASLAESRLEP